MGISGRVARAFLQSKLTPLITIASLALGALAIVATPREEEPQISVPMIDVIAVDAGRHAERGREPPHAADRARMWEIPGVEHVYSMAGEGYALVTVRFKVGENQDRERA